MVMLELEAEGPTDHQITSFEYTVSGMIGLSGDTQGILNIHCPYGTAKMITGNLLGLEVENVDEDVRDAIGEITNMVAGGLKVCLATEGVKIDLSVPTTIAGDSFTINRISKAEWIIIPFKSADERILVDFQYILHP